VSINSSYFLTDDAGRCMKCCNWCRLDVMPEVRIEKMLIVQTGYTDLLHIRPLGGARKQHLNRERRRRWKWQLQLREERCRALRWIVFRESTSCSYDDWASARAIDLNIDEDQLTTSRMTSRGDDADTRLLLLQAAVEWTLATRSGLQAAPNPL